MNDVHPNNLNIADFLEEIWQHQLAHPNHGPHCICMDDFISRLRKATRMNQQFIDLYMQDETGEHNVKEFETRTLYVFLNAMSTMQRPGYRRTDQCYCCSCNDGDLYSSYKDPYCRMHGFAGERPCSQHHSPGTVDENQYPLSSVQEKRASYGRTSANLV